MAARKQKSLGQICYESFMRRTDKHRNGWSESSLQEHWERAAAAVAAEYERRMETEFVCTSCWERFPEKKPKAKKAKGKS